MTSVASTEPPLRTGEETDYRLRLRRLFADARVELAIAVLILISISLMLAELLLSPDPPLGLVATSYAITVLFAVELSLRFVAVSDRENFVRPYFRRWWIDLLAVFPALLIPVVALLTPVRALRLLRFFRLLRLGRLFSSARYFLPHVVRRGAVHFSIVTAASLTTVVVATALIVSFERGTNDEYDSVGEAFWFSLYSLLAGEPVPGVPQTTEARIAAVLVMLMSLLVFAAFIGAVSAYMVDYLQKEGGHVTDATLEDHIILCGLSQLGYRTLESLLRLKQNVVVVEGQEDSEFVDMARDLNVPVVIDSARKPNLLEDFHVDRARAVIACTDDDLTNLEIALDARHLNPDVRIVLRLFDKRLGDKMAEALDIQVAFSSSSLAAPSFAAAAIDRSVQGSLDVGERLYIHCEFEIPEASPLAGRTVSEVRNEYEVHTLMLNDTEFGQQYAPTFDSPLPGGAIISVVGPFDQVALLKEHCGITADLVRAFHNSSGDTGRQ
ncbi:MAG: NAD-binding protein [Acidimicrobiia bacterium]